MNMGIISYQSNLDVSFTRAKKVTDMAIQADLAKYLCVQTSGFIEESLRLMLADYVKKRSNLIILHYLETHLSRITNCKNERILEILRAFEPSWEREYLSQISDTEIKNAIDSVINNRHNIAHGKSVGISLGTIENYYTNVKKAITILDNIIQ
jgi:hypothetical protein